MAGVALKDDVIDATSFLEDFDDVLYVFILFILFIYTIFKEVYTFS